MGVSYYAVLGVQSDLDVTVIFGPTGATRTEPCECGATTGGVLFCQHCGTKPKHIPVEDFTAPFKQLCASRRNNPIDVSEDILDGGEYGFWGVEELEGIRLWGNKFSTLVTSTGSSQSGRSTEVTLDPVDVALAEVRLKRFCALMGHPDAKVKVRLLLDHC